MPTMAGYTGCYRDRCSNTDVLGAGYRLYSAALMRFTSSDDWSPFDIGGINAYAYCAEDPINHHDRSGHAPWSWIGKLARRVRAGLRNNAPIAAQRASADMRSTGPGSATVTLSGRHVGAAEPTPNYRAAPLRVPPSDEEIADEEEHLLQLAALREVAFDDMMEPIGAEAGQRLAAERDQVAILINERQMDAGGGQGARPGLVRSNSMFARHPYRGEIADVDRVLAHWQFHSLAGMWRSAMSEATPFEDETARTLALDHIREQVYQTVSSFVSSRAHAAPGPAAPAGFILMRQ